MAADMRMPVKAAPAPVITLFSWTGCYIGGHAGYAWGKKRIDFAPNIFGVEYDHDVDGFIAGGQIGCNLWQRDRWVLGIEGQASWADIDGSVGPFPGITADQNSFRTEADVIGSIAARLGYAFGATGQTLIFVKGGAAFIHERFYAFNDLFPALNLQSDKDLRWGWMVGGGFEQALNSNWSLKAEYNYSNFGTRDVDLCAPGPICETYSIKQHVHLVKVGINYRFGGPVVARY
jgi:outer membrane immunogenic protein